MDVYQKENVEGEDLLEDTDVQALEEDIETQAVDSGFASEVAERVADAAMETESFEELQESLKEDMNADIMVQSQGYGQLRKARAAGGAGGSRVELGVPTVKANLGTTLKHFDGDVSGLRLALEIGVPITVHVNRGADIEIMITATFEQEVRVSIDVDGSAVWKTWGFIPYIADYRVTASLELYEYTGIGLNVNFKTAETGNPVSDSSSKLRKGVNKITEELKNMMENGEDYLNSASGLVSGGDEISVSKSLAERYSELLADEADWVEIYKRPLVDQHFRVLLIIDIQVKLEFVVSANVNISIGMTYWYKNAKEYVFCVRVKERTATNDTIDLVEEQYEFTAYAMGTLGIKAGVRLTVRVGLLSTSIASVGISADVGGYAQVWGYLYYELKYTASAGRSSRAMGAMYLEIGIYLEVKFEAQALSNAFTYNPTLYENEWPLYKVGVLENVLDFAYTQDKVAEINMKREIQSVQIPDEYFKMQYMDMKTGLDDGKYYEKIYEDDTKYFNISMTNSAFTYDPATNIIRVNPGDEPEQDGEMIITWKNQEGTFNTKPCARKIKLHWDRLRDGYYIAFQSNGGSFVDAITGKYNAEIKKPEDPVRLGYTFAGWYEDMDLTIPYTIPETMPEEDRLVYAKWEAADVGYTVVDYIEGTNGTYEAQTPVKMSGRTEEKVSPVPAERTGFVTPPQLTETVKADGSLVINYYYARNKYTQTFKSEKETENGTETEVIADGNYRYGTMMPTPAVYRPGYEFLGWEDEEGAGVPKEVPSENKTYIAKWKALEGITYTVKYYVQNTDNSGYSLSETAALTGQMGEEVTAKAADLDEKVYHLKGELPKGTIKADGSLVLKVYYDLNEYKLTFDAKGGESDQTEVTARYGDKIASPMPTRKGYVFEGWYTDAEFKKAFDGVVPDRDITLYAKWDVQSVNYTVKHCLQNANDDGYSLGAQENFSADTDTVVTPKVKNFDGFTAPEKQQVTVEGDGRTTVIYRYTRNVHTLTLKNYDGKTDKTVEARYEMSIPKPTRAGYAFAGWYTDAKCTKEYKANMPDQDLTLYAKWEANIVNYVVEHYQQNVQGDGYTLKESSHARAAVDSEVTPEVMKYKGFEEPKTEKVTISGDGQTTVKYYYKRKVHTVTFDADSGTFAAEKGEDDSKIVVTGRYGANITVPKAPTRTGYQFLGWDEDVEMTIPDKDLTYKAQWLKMEYTLQFKTGEGTSVSPIKGNYGDKISVPKDPTRTGYIFKYWSENGKKVDKLPTTMPAESHIYTAIWEQETYQITYDLNGGSMKSGEKNPTTYNVDTTVFKLKNPVRAGYTFTGWSGTQITGVSDNVSVKQGSTDNRTYKENWRENIYQITFILSGTEAKGSMAAKTVNYTENVTLPKCGFTCKGHSFKRWYTVDKKGKKTYYSDRQKVSKLTDVNGGVVTLYPEWEANVYNVTFDYGDGRAKTVRKTKYDDKYQFPSDPTRYGWEFKGWKKEGANTAFDMSTKELQLQDAKDITLYASWKANSFYVYKPSDYGNTYRVNDDGKTAKFTFYVDGNQTKVPTTGDTGQNPAVYHMNMTNLSYETIHQNFTSMEVEVVYKTKKIKDGYSDLKISYHTRSDNKDHNDWQVHTEDLNKNNGNLRICDYYLMVDGKIDVDSLTLEFDAHGDRRDEYDLSNLIVSVYFR